MNEKPEFPSDESILAAILTIGTIGALIGFGITGTAQGACLGGGIGSGSIVAFMVLCALV